MSLILLLSLLGSGFKAQLSYEPTFMAKERPLEAFFLPYGVHYFNNRISAKAGYEFRNGMALRGVGGFAQSFMRDGPTCISSPAPSAFYHSALWRSLEASAGVELGYGARFRPGKGEVFWGAEGVWGSWQGEPTYVYYDEDYYVDHYETLDVSATGWGMDTYLGLSYPLASFKRTGIRLCAAFKGGGVYLEPDNLPSGVEWTGYPTRSGLLPRWGVSVGINFAFDNSKVRLHELPDARYQHSIEASDLPTHERCLACRCLYGSVLPAGERNPLFVQSVSAFLSGPALGVTVGLMGSAMLWDSPDEDFYKYPLGVGFYLIPPVGSVLATMGSGAIVNPGGSWKYTVTWAYIGTLANFVLAQSYIMITGRKPTLYTWPPSQVRLNWDVIGVMALGSIFPAAGAVIGYNLSLKHAREAWPEQDDMGGVRSWNKQVREGFVSEWNQRTKPRVELALVRVKF